MSLEIIPFSRPDKMQEAGIPFDTKHKVEWAYRNRHTNGLAGCFVWINGRRHVDAPKFLELVRKQHAR
jgi:hypothetical protein